MCPDRHSCNEFVFSYVVDHYAQLGEYSVIQQLVLSLDPSCLDIHRVRLFSSISFFVLCLTCLHPSPLSLSGCWDVLVSSSVRCNDLCIQQWPQGLHHSSPGQFILLHSSDNYVCVCILGVTGDVMANAFGSWPSSDCGLCTVPPGAVYYHQKPLHTWSSCMQMRTWP